MALKELSYSEAAVLAVQREMQADARVVVLGEDVGRGGIFGQYKGLQQAFGAERVIDTPISEAAIMGAGVGMALAGLRPVVEMRVVDFALCGMDELVNQAAKNRFMFGGQGRVPLVARMPGGIWDASAAQHSQSLEAWFAHLPGVVVVSPSTPQDNYGLLRAALQCGDPVVYIEHKTLWGLRGEVDEDIAVPLGKAARVREGNALTLVSWSRQMQACAAACDALAAEGIAVDLDRPAHAVAVGPRDGALVLRAHRAPAGRARGGAGRGLRRRDRGQRRRGHGLPHRAARGAAHSGRLCAGAGSAVAHRRGGHRGRREEAAGLSLLG
jgi:pyruvate/2-oxoglutarate/acetoin dehydrogenase E1 component